MIKNLALKVENCLDLIVKGIRFLGQEKSICYPECFFDQKRETEEKICLDKCPLNTWDHRLRYQVSKTLSFLNGSGYNTRPTSNVKESGY